MVVSITMPVSQAINEHSAFPQLVNVFTEACVGVRKNGTFWGNTFATFRE